MQDKIKNKSKYLSLILRHQPELIGITLDKAGWVGINILLKAINIGKSSHWSRKILEEVVNNNDKQRFAISDDGKRIRANQGHSIDIDLGYDPIEPPASLFHGTSSKAIDNIWDKGLQRMKRHHVHLSVDIETAKQVGSRRGNFIVLIVDTAQMYKDGYLFYLSDNKVWLTDNVPSKYFSIILSKVV